MAQSSFVALDGAAVAAAWHIRFTSGQVDEVSVEVTLHVPVTFRPDSDPRVAQPHEVEPP